jgi:hypothetical protein
MLNLPVSVGAGLAYYVLCFYVYVYYCSCYVCFHVLYVLPSILCALCFCAVLCICLCTGHTQNNVEVSIVFTIETAPFFCVYPVYSCYISLYPCTNVPTTATGWQHNSSQYHIISYHIIYHIIYHIYDMIYIISYIISYIYHIIYIYHIYIISYISYIIPYHLYHIISYIIYIIYHIISYIIYIIS